MYAIQPLSGVGKIQGVWKVEEALGAGEAVVVEWATAVEQGVHQTPLLFTHCSLGDTLLKI